MSKLQPYELLEHKIARWVGTESNQIVACSSGTAALHLALESLDLPPKSKVICPDFTMVACPRAIKMAGLEPVFVDCNTKLLMCLDETKSALTSDTSAVMAVHIYGRQCSMEAIHELVEPRGVAVIEDMAELHGVSPHPRTDAACWSFYKNKIVAGEEGGAVYFKDHRLAKRAKQLRCLGFTEEHDFTHLPRGHNYRLANCLAEKISQSLGLYHVEVGERRANERDWNALCPKEWRMPERQSPWVYDLRIPGMSAATQNEVVRVLQKSGVAARHAFKPMSSQPEFVTSQRIGCGAEASRAAREVIYLPLDPQGASTLDMKRAFTLILETLCVAYPSWELPSLD